MVVDAKTVLSYVVLAALVAIGGWLVAVLASAFIRRRWPPVIPDGLGFSHEVTSDLSTRAFCDELVRRFAPHNGQVVCLGRVRGPKAAVLFHAGEKNRGRNVNIHRPDYLLHARRRGTKRIVLELSLNLPYSYFRLHRGELAQVQEALQTAYGTLRHV